MGVLVWFLDLSLPDWPRTGSTVFAIAAAIGYVLASLSFGWPIVSQALRDAEEEPGTSLLWAAGLGCVVAPFRIGGMFKELR